MTLLLEIYQSQAAKQHSIADHKYRPHTTLHAENVLWINTNIRVSKLQ